MGVFDSLVDVDVCFEDCNDSVLGRSNKRSKNKTKNVRKDLRTCYDGCDDIATERSLGREAVDEIFDVSLVEKLDSTTHISI